MPPDLPDAPYEERALALRCGDDTLPAIVGIPSTPATRGVLVIVGGPQYRAGSHRQFTLLARSLAAQGVPVMRFDARGMGDGEGAQRPFDQLGDDVRAAIDGFIEHVPSLRDVVLWGLCDGASAAVLYAGGDARVAGLVLLNPWARDEASLAKTMLKHYYLRRLFDPALWRKVASGRFDARASGASLLAHLGKLRGRVTSTASAPPSLPPSMPGAEMAPAGHASPAPLAARLYAGLQQFTGPVLLVISPGDMTAMEFLGMANGSRPWRKLMRAPRITRRDVPGADHTFSSRQWRDQVANWTIQWLRSW